MDLVWYTSYGSNISTERFGIYLTGGVPPGATHEHAGARDATPPRDEAHTTIAGGLYFAGTSQGWGGGGIAFFDPDVEGEVWAKRYLITAEQFADVLAQETGDSGRYDRVIALGAVDTVPMLTFTSPANRTDLNPASAAYRSCIAGGLAGRPNTTASQIDAYLAGWPPAATLRD